ncbi:hypothetical protein T492DRAFT_1027118 [Pavlovales sp. CCMP2436]|nr:hypothetical protein T492DRAFT_1027118 [Pavlovales sp. CCMP2436]
MPSAMAHHMTTCLALALCSLPKASSSHPRTRVGRLAGSRIRVHTSAPISAALGGGLGGVGGLVPPGSGGGSGGSGGLGPGDGVQDSPDEYRSLVAWLVGDKGRRAAIAGAGWVAAVTWSVELARSEAGNAPGIIVERNAGVSERVVVSSPAAFSGRWVLSASENFDAYLQSVGVSALHRRYACSASVSQNIETATRDGAPALAVCVINQLGTRCEISPIDGKPVRSQDVRGDDIVKVTSLGKPALGQCGPVCVTEVRHSRNGVMYERRYLTAEGAMVMELTSPSGVVARRIFKKAPEPAAV